MDDLVVIRTFFHRHDAEMALGLLKEAGIEAFISADDVGGYRPHITLSMDNNRLMIKPSDAKKAEEVLAVLDQTIEGQQEKNLEQEALDAESEKKKDTE